MQKLVQSVYLNISEILKFVTQINVNKSKKKEEREKKGGGKLNPNCEYMSKVMQCINTSNN